MTSATSSTPTHDKTIAKAVDANEYGQITNLEPNAAYFVIRRPTVDFTKERSRAFVTEVKDFLHEQRIVTEKQVQEFQEKYGEPAKAKAKELRQTMERRFDEIAKDVDARVAKLESEWNERAPAALKRKSDSSTPGEMPSQ